MDGLPLLPLSSPHTPFFSLFLSLPKSRPTQLHLICEEVDFSSIQHRSWTRVLVAAVSVTDLSLPQISAVARDYLLIDLAACRSSHRDLHKSKTLTALRSPPIQSLIPFIHLHHLYIATVSNQSYSRLFPSIFRIRTSRQKPLLHHEISALRGVETFSC